MSSSEESYHCNESPKEDLLKLAQEYREDWSGFDGRMFSMQVSCIADRIYDNEAAKKELYRLGAEYRADWSDVDGRMIQCELCAVADML